MFTLPGVPLSDSTTGLPTTRGLSERRSAISTTTAVRSPRISISSATGRLSTSRRLRICTGVPPFSIWSSSTIPTSDCIRPTTSSTGLSTTSLSLSNCTRLSDASSCLSYSGSGFSTVCSLVTRTRCSCDESSADGGTIFCLLIWHLDILFFSSES